MNVFFKQTKWSITLQRICKKYEKTITTKHYILLTQTKLWLR